MGRGGDSIMSTIQPLPSVSALAPGTWTPGTMIPGIMAPGPVLTTMAAGPDHGTIPHIGTPPFGMEGGIIPTQAFVVQHEPLATHA